MQKIIVKSHQRISEELINTDFIWQRLKDIGLRVYEFFAVDCFMNLFHIRVKSLYGSAIGITSTVGMHTS